MFLQACVTHSVQWWGGGGGHQHQWSTTSPPLGPGQNVYPLPPWDQVRMSTPSPPPGPGQNVYPLPPLGPSTPMVNHLPPPPPGTRSECLPPPPLWDQVRMSTPSPPPWDQVRMSTPPPRLHAGGRYASYWNAFLLDKKSTSNRRVQYLRKYFVWLIIRFTNGQPL